MKFIRDMLAIYGFCMVILLFVYLVTGGARLVVDVLLAQGAI